MEEKQNREQWGSKIGFILATAGSAVGLGNIWRFPYIAGVNGGAAFILIYIAAILLIGYPLMCTEVALGRRTQKNPVGAFASLSKGKSWRFVGGLIVLVAFFILSYYSVIGGWSLAYMTKSVIGGFKPTFNYEELFTGHISQVWEPIIWHGIFMILTIVIIESGVLNGIQKWSKILMPGLFILLLALAIRSMTLSGASEGIAFFLKPDFSKITFGTIQAAISQAFYSLSIGMGPLITYGSYLSKKDNIPDNVGWVAGADTTVAIIAGLAIFPAVFAMGYKPNAGAGLAFITLPAVFSQMAGGSFFGFIFFVLLSVAALTSAMSLLEVVVAWIIDEKGWNRRKASIGIGILVFIVGIPATLGYSVLSDVKFLGMDLLDTYDFITNNIVLPITGLFTAIFAAYIWKVEYAMEEINTPKGKITFGSFYRFLIMVIIPIAVCFIMIMNLIEKFGA
ncbi:MAG: sodium-dependent transporter [Xylanivirga thermophila]|jgi:neurotransmitter:Na+ symporter, NSS family|uniref:sodium-dependent transporter n=1 Tax=Xylanivirga thermophila TaxID=2496273 RepID=UPI00101BFFF5|nr:sodium-dependent transporter [Xylanivirga thermophila]